MIKKQTLLYVGVGTALMLLLGIVYSYSMFRLRVEELYDVDTFLSGVPYMVALFFFALFMAVGGMLYSRFNTKIIATFGLLFIVIGFFLSSLATSILTLTITYGVLVGMGVGISYGLPLRIVAQLDDPKLGFLTGIVLLGFGMSPLIFAPLINSMIQNFGLQQTFVVLSIIFFVTMIPLVGILSYRDTLPKTHRKMSFDILKNPKFQKLYFLFFIGTFIGLTFIGFTGTVGKEFIDLDVSAIALLVGVFSIFNGVGRPLFGFFHDSFGFKKSATFSFISLIVITLLYYFFSSSPVIYIISFIIFYLNFGGWLSLAPSTTIELFGKEEYSKNFGLLYTAYGVGALIGNLISGYLVETVGLRSIFLLMSFVAVIGLLYVNIGFKDYKKE